MWIFWNFMVSALISQKMWSDLEGKGIDKYAKNKNMLSFNGYSEIHNANTWVQEPKNLTGVQP